MFELKKTEGKARRGEFTCAHGTVQTPVFMNVGTQGAIKTSGVRWSCPIPTICICVPRTRWCARWGDCISS